MYCIILIKAQEPGRRRVVFICRLAGNGVIHILARRFYLLLKVNEFINCIGQRKTGRRIMDVRLSVLVIYCMIMLVNREITEIVLRAVSRAGL